MPPVKYFPDRVKAVDRKYIFQNVVLTRFEQGRGTSKNTKDIWVKLTSEAVSKFSSIILNKKGWKNSDTNDEFGVEAIPSLYEHFQMPLEQAGFNRALSQLLEQWQSLCNYLSTTYCQKELNIVLFDTRFSNQAGVVCGILFYCE